MSENINDKKLEQLIKTREQLEKLRKKLGDTVEGKLQLGKTQMLGKRENVRTRKSHSENIIKIVQAIIEKIYQEKYGEQLSEEQEAEMEIEIEKLYASIIGFAHDLGHTPFGHLGERILNKFVAEKAGEIKQPEYLKMRKDVFGADYETAVNYSQNPVFKHTEWSAIFFSDFFGQYAEKKGTDSIDKNRILRGILTHSGSSKVEDSLLPEDLASQLIRIVDKVENAIYDFEEIKELFSVEGEVGELVGKTAEEKEKDFVDFIARLYREQDGDLRDIHLIKEKMTPLNKFTLYAIKYMDFDSKEEGQLPMPGVLIGENSPRITVMVRKILEYYYMHPDQIPSEVTRLQHPNDIAKKKDYKEKEEAMNDGMKVKHTHTEDALTRLIEFYCKLDDTQVYTIYKKLVRQRAVHGEGHGIYPITQEEVKKEIEEQLKKSSQSKENIREKMNEIGELLSEAGVQQIEEARRIFQQEAELDTKLAEFIDTVQGGNSTYARGNAYKDHLATVIGKIYGR